MTVNDLIKGAFRLLNLIEEEETPSDAMMQDALEDLNTMLHSWQLDGVGVFHTDLSLGDDVALDDSHLRAVKYNLAVELAPNYERDPRQTVVYRAEELYRILQTQYVDIDEVTFDAELTARQNSFNIITG